MRDAVDTLLEMLPDAVSGFEGSQYPLPVATTFLGNVSPDIPALKAEIIEKKDADPAKRIESILIAAELIEANQSDRNDYFISDLKVQSLVFTGSKWRAGWVLVLGADGDAALYQRLKDRGFMVFTDDPDIDGTTFIGSRPTSPVYFLQLMVRYGLVWGRIRPGDDHEMGHFLERDMPGMLMIRRELDPLKYLIALGLMKLGAPAVVPSRFPFPYGRRHAADSAEEAVEKACTFPNLRIQCYKGETIQLPDSCDPAFSREKFDPAMTLGGSAPSFFHLRAVDGEPESRVTGALGGHIGIVVEIGHPECVPDVAATLQADALHALNYLRGVRARVADGAFTLELADGVAFDPEPIQDAIHWGLRLKYPKLKKIGVHVILGGSVLADESARAANDQSARAAFIQAMTEGNTRAFAVCIECRPFSLGHTCLMTPDRIPMCASRTYHTVKAAALFGSTSQPFTRRSEEDIPLRLVFDKGDCLDPDRGEYAGCNAVYQRMTGGRLSRVFLHSVRGYPHTSCGCFQNLAFWIDAVNGLGIMSRRSDAVAPNGKCWADLANMAGGKQTDGIMGVSTAYILSKNFLKGDGGLKNVVWVDDKLYRKIASRFAPDQRVATEKDVSTIPELAAFTGR